MSKRSERRELTLTLSFLGFHATILKPDLQKESERRRGIRRADSYLHLGFVQLK